MTLSTLFQILGSIFVFVGYLLNAKNHQRQHQMFILGHLFLLSFTIIEQKIPLLLLSVFIIVTQYRTSRKKYKFKKDIVRVKKVARKIKVKKNENQGLPKKDHKNNGNRHKEGHVVQSGQGQIS